ncbi:hypothetical protein [Lysobacter sp. Hz 25]|uniref:hypothetical protein n=1 Tax=Lysobacter sp. Hz 25 TaxID=3383698 RepID=UPI0038D4CA8B
MRKAPSNTDDVIDSRDVIERIEELESELGAVHGAQTESRETNLEFEEWLLAVRADASPAHENEHNREVEELQELRSLADQCDHVSDWVHGETLIRESHFTDYIEQLIDDCYEMPKEMKSGGWPWRHVSFDFEAAAEEAKVDYSEVTFWGETYLIHDC